MTPTAQLYTKKITDLNLTEEQSREFREATTGKKTHFVEYRVYENTLDGFRTMQAELKEDDDRLKRNVLGYYRRPTIHSVWESDDRYIYAGIYWTEE